tara:strand:+ start:976 stop:1299 length:324 start_codon:yes stop_codon:yes gene_type:complete
MAALLWNNFATGLLDAAILAVDTTLDVGTGEGLLFPNPTGGDWVILVIEDTSGNKEVVHMTAKATDTFTILRAQEGTLAQAFALGSRIEMRITSGFLTNMVDGGDYS